MWFYVQSRLVGGARQMSTGARRMSTGARVPLIKFRQGGPAPAAPQAGRPATTTATSRAATIEDWQLPGRYRRRPISEEECLAINMGGLL